MKVSGTISTFVTCPLCGCESVVFVQADGFHKWKSGMLIQNAMPELTSDEREMLISGICRKCWQETFDISE